MDNYSYQRQYQKKAEAHAQRRRAKAMEPQIRRCYILDMDVHILVEYPDYKNPNVKGQSGEIFCSNILNCYRNNVKCRWSGISPHYPNPFNPDAPRHNNVVF
ncbi:MAG: hypothetical protein K8T10_19140 [Candidatus Eremiobacteraeota bacterium]|nr:hypothetical protein [Candidatus Eremiobacteraeota bacterium]